MYFTFNIGNKTHLTTNEVGPALKHKVGNKSHSPVTCMTYIYTHTVLTHTHAHTPTHNVRYVLNITQALILCFKKIVTCDHMQKKISFLCKCILGKPPSEHHPSTQGLRMQCHSPKCFLPLLTKKVDSYFLSFCVVRFQMLLDVFYTKIIFILCALDVYD